MERIKYGSFSNNIFFGFNLPRYQSNNKIIKGSVTAIDLLSKESKKNVIERIIHLICLSLLIYKRYDINEVRKTMHKEGLFVPLSRQQIQHAWDEWQREELLE